MVGEITSEWQVTIGSEREAERMCQLSGYVHRAAILSSVEPNSNAASPEALRSCEIRTGLPLHASATMSPLPSRTGIRTPYSAFTCVEREAGADDLTKETVG